MDIMMRLKGAGFSMIANEFRQREKRLGTGLPLQDFVEIVLQGLPKPAAHEEKLANVNALVDLFEAMDINGDGTMEFDEFTSYCVDAGMIATRNQAAKLKHRYVRNTKHVIKTMNGSVGVEKVRWSPLFKRFLVLENAAKSVKLFDMEGSPVGEIGVQSASICTPISGASSPLSTKTVEKSPRGFGGGDGEEVGGPSKRANEPGPMTTTTGGSSASSASGNGIFILDAALLYKFQCLAMSTTDFVISFYSLEEPKHQQLRQRSSSIHAAGPTYDLLPKLTITTTNAQLILRFCEHAGLLLSAGNDFIVNVWKITDVETKVLCKRLVHHRDMIMDILEIPVHDMIASCDLHHTIQLWDIHDSRSRGALVGHTRGIKQMVFSNDHDLLLTAGFEFDGYGWDLASRQPVMKLVGHRAPLIGVQLAVFQTERAVTGDASGVFKVWDISRTSGSSGGNNSAFSSSGANSRGATHAVLLESLDPSQHLSRFEPTTFVCLYPLSRDLWAAASGSATLHLFRSTRVQQFDEIPLRAFYNYTSNRFVVVCGPVCSIWDGATGACLDECTHVGGGSRRRPGNGTLSSNELPSSSHNGSDNSAAQSMEASSTDVLLCTQDAKCNKLVVVAEDGELGVFNSQNLVQMRRCEECFVGGQATTSCGIVGLHYCTENKLVVMTDSHHGAILVIDDSNNDATKGLRETQVLRRLVHVPGGISASAYGYHASLVATVDERTGRSISLWDFETLSFVAQCELEEEDDDNENRLAVLEFWDEFPVLLAADLRGCVYLYAVTTTKAAATGKLLHAFVNADSILPQRSTSTTSTTDEPIPTDGSSKSATFLTEATESAARKFLMKKQPTVKKSPRASSSSAIRLGSIVTSMRVVYEDPAEGQSEGGRYLLFTGDEKGVVRVWDLSQMLRRLSLFKIPESHCKYLRRGYHPRAMFARDFSKEEAMKRANPSVILDVYPAVELGVLQHSAGGRKASTKSSRNINKKKTPAASTLAKLLGPNRLQPGYAPPAASSVAVAEAFLVRRSSSMSQSSPAQQGALINTRDKPSTDRRRSLCWQLLDVVLLHSWGAHSDGVTSLEVSKHPNILVTCALDMRVFVWDWGGGCLGKLFDAENVGTYGWKFQRDDATRQKEREVLVNDLLRELELPAHAKAHRRRQTLYASHVQRTSQHALRHASVMLVEHIVSQHPEIAAMEKAQGLSGAEVSRFTDQSVIAEMKMRSRRNHMAKRRMLATVEKLSSTDEREEGVEAEERAKHSTRMHSLAQVGPLLCVDKFESKNELEQMCFAEKDELAMDSKYLQDELAIEQLPKGTAGRQRTSTNSLASIRPQILSTKAHAEEMLANKAALRRHASAMYVNLHRPKKRQDDPARGENNNDLSKNDAILEPSPFLKGKLPSHLLTLRPQTAPSPKGLTRSASTSAIKKKTELRPLTASATPSLILGDSSAHRRSSLDMMYVVEIQRQQQQNRSPVKRLQVNEHDEDPAQASSSHDGFEANSLMKLDTINDIITRCGQVSSAVETPDPSTSRPQTAPSSAPKSSKMIRGSKSIVALPTLHEAVDRAAIVSENPSKPPEDIDTLRAHIETTRRRMEQAMQADASDEEDRGSPGRGGAPRSAASVRERRKHKRMHDYLQQKRREMNTNIGAVFKRTSFAFPMTGANAANEVAATKSQTSIQHQRAILEGQAKVDKSKVFGIYGVKEVMSILRLFGSMDEDGSGVLTLQELLAYRAYFEKLGYHDMTTVFQAIDKDGSGSITLRELLEVCFPYGTNLQVEEMVKLAKLGDIAIYFDSSHSKRRSQSAGSERREPGEGENASSSAGGGGGVKVSQPVLTEEERAELLGIFHVFDRNGDGGVSIEEILEALHIDEDEALARVEAAEEAQLALREQGSRRRLSVSPPHTSSTSSAATRGFLTKADVRKLYQDFDSNGDKTLNFDEFVLLMQTIYGR